MKLQPIPVNSALLCNVVQSQKRCVFSPPIGRVYYRALVHFVHLLWVLSVFTLSDPAELSTLEVPGWSTRNGEKMKWKTMVTTRTKRAPSWLRSGKGGALSAAFHKKSTFILAGLVSRVSRADLCTTDVSALDFSVLNMSVLSQVRGSRHSYSLSLSLQVSLTPKLQKLWQHLLLLLLYELLLHHYIIYIIINNIFTLLLFSL